MWYINISVEWHRIFVRRHELGLFNVHIKGEEKVVFLFVSGIMGDQMLIFTAFEMEDRRNKKWWSIQKKMWQKATLFKFWLRNIVFDTHFSVSADFLLYYCDDGATTMKTNNRRLIKLCSSVLFYVHICLKQ